MSLNGVMSGALSGLYASQAGLRAASNNIANVNTPGYARQEATFSARVMGDVTSGVDVDAIRRVTDRFLVSAALNATSGASGAELKAQFLDRAQAMFGDPANGTSLFDDIDRVFASFGELTTDPSSTVRRSNAIADVQTLLGQFDLMSDQLQTLRTEADNRLTETVNRANELIAQIVDLNGAVQRARISGDATGAENLLDNAIEELSNLMDISVDYKTTGAVEVRTGSGVLLAGMTGSTLSYQSPGQAAPGAVFPAITITTSSGSARDLDADLRQGELKALIDLRDRELPALSRQLGELAAHTSEAINAAHNTATSFPPPTQLAGAPSGFRGADPLNVTGGPPATTQIVITDDQGALQHTLTIDFTAQTVTRDSGGAPVVTGYGANTVNGLVGALNTALAATGAGGSATFSADGEMTLTAGGAGRIAVVEPETNAARMGGRGFSHAFALNNLITGPQPLSHTTGLSAASVHGFGATAGEEIGLRLLDRNGRVLAEPTITPVAGQTVAQLLTQLNDPANGVGNYGTFSAPDADGRILFTPGANYPGLEVRVLTDTTVRQGSGGNSFTDMFGIGDAALSGRARDLTVREDILASPATLSLSQIELAGRAVGDVVTGLGDNGGAEALFQASNEQRSFLRPDGRALITTTLRNFAAQTGAEAGRMARSAETTAAGAVSMRTEATERLAATEGVNIDEELIKLTAFQQAYNANSRMLQAVNEMFDTLLSIV